MRHDYQDLDPDNETPVQRTIEQSIEQAVRSAHHSNEFLRRLREKQGLYVTEDNLSKLRGILVTEGWYGGICTARDLQPAERLFLYFHMLGHMALGHTHVPELEIVYEYRTLENLSLAELFFERQVDRWAKLLLKRLLRQHTAQYNGLRLELRDALKAHEDIHGSLVRRNVHDLSTVLFARFRQYRRWRASAPIIKLRHRLGRAAGNSLRTAGISG